MNNILSALKRIVLGCAVIMLAGFAAFAQDDLSLSIEKRSEGWLDPAGIRGSFRAPWADQGFRTGLRPPTAEERAWAKANKDGSKRE